MTKSFGIYRNVSDVPQSGLEVSYVFSDTVRNNVERAKEYCNSLEKEMAVVCPSGRPADNLVGEGWVDEMEFPKSQNFIKK